MHARITRLQFRNDRFYEAGRTIEQEILPHLRREHGFVHMYIMANRATGEGTVLTLWASEEDERDSRARVEHRFGRVAHSLTAPPQPAEILQVVFEGGPEGSRR
jgi:hypothetical protein